jgi:hypothetical protein
MRYLLTALAFLTFVTAASADDRHAGYYYPTPGTIETYISRAKSLQGIERRQRIGFVVGFTQALTSQPYAPPYAVFVKGDEAEKLIIVGYHDGELDTIYRARALLAQLTSTARTMPALRERNVDDFFTFLDFLKLMGFDQITVSDGKNFAHQVLIQ